MDVLQIIEILGRRRLSHAARRQLLISEQKAASLQRIDEAVLRQRTEDGSPFLSLGISKSEQPVRISLNDAMASSIICGSTGSGKTKAAEIFLREIVKLSE